VTEQVAAVVLAAGASRRLGQPKQLLLMNGETLLARAVRLAVEAGTARAIVVLGAEDERIRATVDFGDALPVTNSNWQQGMAGSIHAGLRALLENLPAAEAALILACDQPLLTAEHLRALLEAFAAESGAAIVASAYAGKMGIPAVFPRALFAELLALSGDQGARALLMNPPCPVIPIPFPGGEIDIDLPGDLNQLK